MVKTRSLGILNFTKLGTSARCGGGKEGKLSVSNLKTVSNFYLFIYFLTLKRAQLFG